MGVMMRDRAQESALMEQSRITAAGGSASSVAFSCQQLLPEPQLPSGWEKCLDLKSGLIYFKDWNSGTLTYRDPRRSVAVTAQRIGLLSISLSLDVDAATNSPTPNAGDVGEPSETTNSMDEQSLELTLTPPGTSTVSRPPPPLPPAGTTSSSQEGSVCTMEKVRTALERSQWLTSTSTRNTRIAPLLGQERAPNSAAGQSSILSRPGLSRHHLDCSSSSSSPSTSQSSASDCFTSPSVMSYQGDDESEVLQQLPHGYNNEEIMVTVGCTRCLMFMMLSKSHPSCPRCGNTDMLLELPAPSNLPKRQRMAHDHHSPSAWSWSTA